MSNGIGDPDSFSEKVGNFQLKMTSKKKNIGLVQISRYKVSIIPDGEVERELLSCDDYGIAWRLFVMIDEKHDWRDYKKYLDFLNLK